MKRSVGYSFTFTPTANQISLYGIPSFDVRQLYAILDLSSNSILYAAGSYGLGYSAISGSTLTLQASMAGTTATDTLLILYDDGSQPSAAATVQLAIAGALADSTHRIPVEIDAQSASMALDTTLQTLLGLVGTMGTSAPSLPNTSTGLLGLQRYLINQLAGNINVLLPGSAVPTASFTRPGNTTTYASGQLVANSAAAGAVVVPTLVVARGNGLTGHVSRARLSKNGTLLTNAAFRVHLYSTLPTPSNGDGGAWLTDQTLGYQGACDVTMDKAFTDGAIGVGIPNVGTKIGFTTGTGQAILYALVEARASYVPNAAEVFTISLECERD